MQRFIVGRDDCELSGAREVPRCDDRLREQVATNATSTETLDEGPLEARTVTDCPDRATWKVVAAEHQGRGIGNLFPPKPLGGLDNVLDQFCSDNAGAPACDS